MPIYFLLHDADRFRRMIRPALAGAWRRRTFEPCRALCAALAPAALAFADRYHTGHDEPLLAQVARGTVPFDRDFWRLLVGEVLLYGAAAVPEILTAPDTLCRLLAPGQADEPPASRSEFAPIRQAHFGARDLVFGGFYRPEAAGYNDADDVSRLADYLATIDPARWTVADLAGLREFADDAERADELEFAREVFPPLRDLYGGARDVGQVVVCEVL
jgi:hypothetical protein